MSRRNFHAIAILLFCLVSIMILPTFAQGMVIVWPVPDGAVIGDCDTSIVDLLLTCDYTLDEKTFHLSLVITPDGTVVFTNDFVDDLKTKLASDPILDSGQKQSVMGKLEQAQSRLNEGRYGLAGLSLYTATNQYFQIVNIAQGDRNPDWIIADAVARVLMNFGGVAPSDIAGAITPSDHVGAITPSDLVGNQTPLDHVGAITLSD